MASKHEEKWRISSAVMDCRIVGVNKCRDVCFPITFPVIIQCPKHLKQSLVKTLHLAVSHGVVGCRSRLLHSSNPSQLLDEFRIKTLSLIAMDPGRKTIVDMKLSNNSLAAVLAVCFLVGNACTYLEKWSVITNTCSRPLWTFQARDSRYRLSPSVN